MKNVRVIVITTVLLCVRQSACVLLVLFFKILRLFYVYHKSFVCFFFSYTKTE